MQLQSDQNQKSQGTSDVPWALQLLSNICETLCYHCGAIARATSEKYYVGMVKIVMKSLQWASSSTIKRTSALNA